MQPTIKNLIYYRGDDFTIMIVPKDSTGSPVPIGGSTPYFRVASSRGDTPLWSGQCSADIGQAYAGGPQVIICSMTSAQGVSIKNGYVYDIGFIKNNKYTTVLTGQFQVMDRVKGA